MIEAVSTEEQNHETLFFQGHQCVGGRSALRVGRRGRGWASRRVSVVNYNINKLSPLLLLLHILLLPISIYLPTRLFLLAYAL